MARVDTEYVVAQHLRTAYPSATVATEFPDDVYIGTHIIVQQAGGILMTQVPDAGTAADLEITTFGGPDRGETRRFATDVMDAVRSAFAAVINTLPSSLRAEGQPAGTYRWLTTMTVYTHHSAADVPL